MPHDSGRQLMHDFGIFRFPKQIIHLQRVTPPIKEDVILEFFCALPALPDIGKFILRGDDTRARDVIWVDKNFIHPIRIVAIEKRCGITTLFSARIRQADQTEQGLLEVNNRDKARNPFPCL